MLGQAQVKLEVVIEVKAVIQIEVQILLVGGCWWVQMKTTETYANTYHSLPKEKKFKIKQQILLNRKGLQQKILM